MYNEETNDSKILINNTNKRNKKNDANVVQLDDSYKLTHIAFIVFAVSFFIIIVLVIILVGALYDTPSVYKNFIFAINHGGTILTSLTFTKNQIYTIPNITGGYGRAFLSITGAGGGGCSGNYTSTGGGGNSGASAVWIPILIHNADVCMITIGNGGDTNMDGSYTEFKCIPSTGGNPTVFFRLDGGRSGCTPNGTHLGDNSYPFIEEKFGSRPLDSTYAESNIYGGIGGNGLGGGAGSLFGNGGNPGDINKIGQNAPGYGAGGGGGGISSVNGNSYNGGNGGNGFVQFNYFVDIQN